MVGITLHKKVVSHWSDKATLSLRVIKKIYFQKLFLLVAVEIIVLIASTKPFQTDREILHLL